MTKHTTCPRSNVAARSGLNVAVGVVLSGFAATSLAEQLLEEVVVTAQKRAQSAQDVPIAISAMSQARLEETGVDNIAQVLPLLPGVTGSTAGISTSAWAIRSIATQDFTVGSEPSVAVYIDEAYIGRNTLSSSSFFDLERLEVVKGPQGTLFGRNAAAGAITLSTVKPQDENAVKLGAGAGNEGQRVYDLVANGAVSDQFAVRFAYHGTRFDGFVKDVINNENSFRDEDAFRLSARWDLSDSVESLLTLNYGKQEANMNGAYTPALSALAPNQEYVDNVERSTRDREENTTKGANLRVEWEMNESLRFTSITDVRDFEYALAQDVDGSAADALIDGFLGGVTGGVSLSFDQPAVLGDTFSQEFRLSGATDAVEWFAGLNYFQEDVSEIQQLNAVDTLLGLGVLAQDQNSTRGDNTGVGIFADARWMVSDAFALTAGARWTKDEKDWCTEGSAALFFISNITPGQLCGTQSWTDFSPRLVADYQFSNDVMAYASVSRGYKAGGFNTAAADFDGDFVGDAVASFNPETNTAYEVGLKSEFLDGSTRLNIAAYYNDYEDLQIASATLGGILINNASKAKVQGAEMELTFVPSANWQLNASYSFSDGEYTDGVLDGLAMSFAPKNSYVLSTRYDMPMGGNTLSWFGLYSYQSKFYYDTANSLEEAGYGLVSGRVAFIPASEKWDIALSGENLTDKEYASFRADIGLGVGPSINRGLPRTWKLVANVYF